MKKGMKKGTLTGLAVILGVTLTGCVNGTRIDYDDADEYQAGNASFGGDVSKLEIDWVSGEVTIEPSESGQYEIEESSSKNLKDKKKVHYYLDEGTLHIKFCESGINMLGPLKKELVLRIPQDKPIDDIDITSVSADFKMSGITVKNVDASTVSGGIKADIAGVDSFDVESVSGNLELISPDTPSKGDFESVSGDIDITIPKDSEFTLEYDSVSGSIDSDINGRLSKDKLVCGSGEAKYDVETVSGNVKINAYASDNIGEARETDI